MRNSEQFRKYAADCVRKATGSQDPEEKNLHLNLALAWVRLAHQTESIGAGVLADVDGVGHADGEAEDPRLPAQ